MNGAMDTGGKTDGRARQECLRYERSGGLQNNRPIFIPPTESVGGLNKDGCFCLVHVLQSCAVSLHHAARRFGPRYGRARQIHHGRRARGASIEEARAGEKQFQREHHHLGMRSPFDLTTSWHLCRNSADNPDNPRPPFW